MIVEGKKLGYNDPIPTHLMIGKMCELFTDYWQRPRIINEARVECGAFEDEEALRDIVSSLSSLHLIKMNSIYVL